MSSEKQKSSHAQVLSTPSSWGKVIVDTLLEKNVDVTSILSELGIELESLNNRDGVINQDSVTALWEYAAKATNNENIGFEVGAKIHALLNPVIAYSLMSCANLKESCKRLIRYQDVVAEGLQFEMRGSAGHFELVFDILPSIQQPSPQAIKSVVSGCLSFMRWVTRSDIHPTHVNLTEEMPLDLDAYEQLFTCPINFSGKENSLFFLKKDMLEPLVTSDDQLSDIHDQNLQVYRDRIKVQTFADKVKAILMEQLPSGEPKQETIAKLLHVSASTLKRRLKEEDVTYKSLLDETRHQLSLKYLVQESLSLTEITYLLGFSQSSAFTRAFKRWQGVSPKIFVQNNS